MNLSYCSIDSEKRFIGIVEDLNFIRTTSSENLIHTLPPSLEEDQAAFWNGSGWSIRMIKVAPPKEIPTIITQDEQRIQDNHTNANCIQFFEHQLEILNLAIFSKIENNKKVPKKWNEYKKVLTENIELCKTEIIDENSFREIKEKEDSLKLAFDHYQNTNYDTNGQIQIQNGYDLNFLKSSLGDENYKKWYDYVTESNLFPKNVDYSKNIFALASQLVDDKLALFTKIGITLVNIEDEDEDENSETKKVKTNTPSDSQELIFEVSKDFDVVNAERRYVIDKNNIQKFIDDYGNNFKKYEKLFSLPSMIDFLEDKYIYSKNLSFEQWKIKLFNSQRSLFVIDEKQYYEKDVTLKYDMNLYFKNIQNVHELIQSESSKKYTNREKNPSKPIPRN